MEERTTANRGHRDHDPDKETTALCVVCVQVRIHTQLATPGSQSTSRVKIRLRGRYISIYSIPSVLGFSLLMKV